LEQAARLVISQRESGYRRWLTPKGIGSEFQREVTERATDGQMAEDLLTRVMHVPR
jgi:hypothetical protein